MSDPIARFAIMFHCFKSPLSKRMPQRDRVKAPYGCRLPAVVFSWSDASQPLQPAEGNVLKFKSALQVSCESRHCQQAWAWLLGSAQCWVLG